MSLAETAINAFLDRRLAQPSNALARTAVEERSLAKGLIAGVFAGMAGAAAKTLVEKVYPGDRGDQPKTHWVVGAAAGAVYGALAEFYPAATSRDGVTYGMTLMALTHEAGAPALAAQTTREKTSEMASHIVFGLAAEATRSFIRKQL